MNLAVLDDPSQSYQFLEHASGVDHLYSESFLQTAIEHWLSPPTGAFPDAANNIERLALAVQKNHQDLWLRDFLGSPASPKALIFLRSAIAADDRGDHQKAERDARAAESLFLHRGNVSGAARSRFELVYALHRQSDGRKCLSEAGSLKTVVEARHYSWLETQLLIETAICQGLVNHFGEESRLISQALQRAQHFRYPISELRALGIAASFDTSEGRLKQSWSRNEAGLKTFWEGSYPALRGYQFYSALELAAEQAEDWAFVATLQREAVAILEEDTQHLDFKASAHFEMGSVAQMAGDYQTAQREFELAYDLFHQLPNNLTTGIYRINVEVALAELEAKQGQIEAAMRRLAVIQPKIARAHNFNIQLAYWRAWSEVERSRGQTANEERCLGKVISIGQRGFHALRSEKERWDWQREVGPAYLRLLEIEVNRSHDPAQALADREFVYLNGAAKNTGPAMMGDSHARSELLRRVGSLREATLVSFAVFTGNLFIWTADDRGIHEFKVPVPSDELRNEIRTFDVLCSNPHSSLALTRSHGQRLYNWLFAPVEELVRGRHILLIEADGLLNSLPWSAMVTRGGEYLGQLHVILSISGLKPGSGNSQQSGDAKQRVLVALPGAIVAPDGQYLPLPDADTEARMISLLYPNTICLRNKEVTARRLLKELPKASIFHFAGHADTQEYGGVLLLSAGMSAETLSSLDLANLRLKRCKLVVLSACATAAAGQDVVRDPNGLVRAFLAAGSENVIASHWEVDSQATADLMENFYREYNRGTPAAVALEMARQYIRSQASTAHPYFWASFEIFRASH